MDKQQAFWDNIPDWDKDVFNIFLSGSAGPILNRLSQESPSSSVIDLGTGIGHFLPFLSEHFRVVHALDYAPNLLQKARAAHEQYANIRYSCGDMRSLPFAFSSFDIVLSVNSILPSSIDDPDLIISELFRILKRGGLFVGALPAFDAVIYLYFLKYQALRENGTTSEEALKTVEEEMGRHNLHPLGLYSDYPEFPSQKYFYPTEIQYRFSAAGFAEIVLMKLEYSWEYCHDHFYGYFPNAPRIWDWFVTARKP